jgi:hypothetical protein
MTPDQVSADSKRRVQRVAPRTPEPTPASACECQCCPHDGSACACACHDSHQPAEAERDRSRLPAWEWQPMETAPRDGSRFLFSNGQIVGTGLYLMGTSFAADSWQGAHNTTPTHWMPLPPVPSEGDAK